MNAAFPLQVSTPDISRSRITKAALAVVILLFFCAHSQTSNAQANAIMANPAKPFPALDTLRSRSGLRFSLLTVGTGDEIYASFGHTGIRVVDSVAGTDSVSNWGTFEFGDDFELKFMRGKLLYYCDKQTYASFYATYIRERRGVEEQVLFLTPAQQQALLRTIDANMQEENKYYKYDFLFDNCSTRPRELLKTAFGPQFKYGDALKGKKITFRDEINHYLAGLPWERFGINLLLGAKIDRRMSNEDAMFLPDYLRDGLAGATLNGTPVAGPAERILPPAPTEPAPANTPLFVMLFVGAACTVGASIPGFDLIARVLRNAVLVVSGLLGLLMLFMWFGTDHESCRNNWNVLWCLPTNLVLPFVKPAKRSRYAIVGIICLTAALLIHVTGIQALPLNIVWPLILTLYVIFFQMYRSAVAPPLPPEDHHH